MNILWLISGAMYYFVSVSGEDTVGIWDDYFTYSNILNEDPLFKLFWNDYHNDTNNDSIANDIIEFGIEVASTGWIAIGISPTNKMPNSDIMLGWIDADGVAQLHDMYTRTERVTPFLDEEDDLELLYGDQVDGTTRLRFKRPKFPCNDEDLPVKQGTTRIIFATNNEKPTGVSNGVINGLIQHSLFGGKSINLDVGYQTLSEDLVDENTEDIIVKTIRMEEHPIAAQETEYWCKLFELPPLDEIHHIVKFAPWISAGMEPYVHHFNLYQCPVSIVNVSNIGHGAPCDEWGVEENMAARACIGLGVTDAIHVIYAWGVGMVDSVLPEGVGVELGGPLDNDASLRYGMLEMHYDNPSKVEGLIDNSGFTYYYTPNLRPINAGIMTIGHYYDERHFVPQGLTTVNYGYCHNKCTSRGLPHGGVTTFGIFFHAHPIATALSVRHVRDGVELPRIDSDWGYDFDYQQMVAVDDVKILPGDDLILECYETNWRNRTTFGGIETSTEMCLTFLWVYPKPELRTCVSTFTDDDLTRFEQGAKRNGFLNEEANLLQYHAHYNEKHEIPIDYDITKDGAIPFYNNLWLPSDETEDVYSYQRRLLCYDAVGDTVWHDGTVGAGDHVGDIPRFTPREVDEVCYKDDDDEEEEEEESSTQQPQEDITTFSESDDVQMYINVIIAVSVVAAILLILCVIFAVLYYKGRGDNKGGGKYAKVNTANIPMQTNQYENV